MPPVAPAGRERRARRRQRLAWALAVTGLAIGALAIPITRYLSAPEPAVTRLDVVTPPTTDLFSFALSPDGRQLAFVVTADGGSRLWLRPLDEADARPLLGTEGSSYPSGRLTPARLASSPMAN
jgi:hypothetical protein